MSPLEIVLLIIGLGLLFLATALVRSIRNRRQATDLKFGAKPSWLKVTKVDVIYGVAMLAGVVAKEIWDSINETGTYKIRVPRLLGAIIVSPIVYAAVYSQLTQGDLTLLGLAIAFQNGFFWQAVFRTAQGGANAASHV